MKKPIYEKGHRFFLPEGGSTIVQWELTGVFHSPKTEEFIYTAKSALGTRVFPEREVEMELKQI